MTAEARCSCNHIAEAHNDAGRCLKLVIAGPGRTERQQCRCVQYRAEQRVVSIAVAGWDVGAA